MSSDVVAYAETSTNAGTGNKAVALLADAPPFYEGLHVHYLTHLVETLDTSYEGALMEHLRMSGVYWCVTAWSLLATDVPLLQDDSFWDWLFSCYDPASGGFGGNTGQDGHLLYTLSALQVMAVGERLQDGRLQRAAILQFVSSLQQPDGSFIGDFWGEIDTRFTYCALQSLALLQALPENGGDAEKNYIDVDAAARYVLSCRNADGGFGCVPGAESHAGQVFCSVGALSIAQRLHWLDDDGLDALAAWLSERQVDSGGLNGRPEKQADVCYSWWILSTLSILSRTDWIRGDKLAKFILKCQDDEDGGIADRPEDMADVYHTFFGIAGLSLLGYLHATPSSSSSMGSTTPATTTTTTTTTTTLDQNGSTYRQIDPVYALPTDLVQQLALPGQVVRGRRRPIDQRLERYTVLEEGTIA